MTLEQLGWCPSLDVSFEPYRLQGCVPARVARQSYVVYTGQRAQRASVSGSLRHGAHNRADFPAVGDWVAVRPRCGEDAATIMAILPRRTLVQRKAAGQRVEQQVVAANVDTLLVCCGLDADFNLRRIERYVGLAYTSGAAPMILLNKADVCVDVEARVASVEEVAVGVPVIPLSALDGGGVDSVRSHLREGRTAALVGSSGVGKSTLINRLLGRAELRTGAIRAHDGRGRHTTTHRQLLLVPGGGVIIDTPGMRELGLWGDSDAVDSTFAEIDEWARQCRFRDCRHAGEPGCSVQAAIESGQLELGRFESFRKQQRELRYLAIREDAGAQAAEKARWKSIHKAARKWMKQKYRT